LGCLCSETGISEPTQFNIEDGDSKSFEIRCPPTKLNDAAILRPQIRRIAAVKISELHFIIIHSLYTNSYPSPSINRMIKSRKMRLPGHVACMGRRGRRIEFLWEIQKESDH
jgi:hypothetical protein